MGIRMGKDGPERATNWEVARWWICLAFLVGITIGYIVWRVTR